MIPKAIPSILILTFYVLNSSAKTICGTLKRPNEPECHAIKCAPPSSPYLHATNGIRYSFTGSRCWHGNSCVLGSKNVAFSRYVNNGTICLDYTKAPEHARGDSPFIEVTGCHTKDKGKPVWVPEIIITLKKDEKIFASVKKVMGDFFSKNDPNSPDPDLGSVDRIGVFDPTRAIICEFRPPEISQRQLAKIVRKLKDFARLHPDFQIEVSDNPEREECPNENIKLNPKMETSIQAQQLGLTAYFYWKTMGDDRAKVTIDFGDGAKEERSTNNCSECGKPVQCALGDHQYKAPGRYQVKVTASDGFSAQKEFIIENDNNP